MRQVSKKVTTDNSLKADDSDASRPWLKIVCREWHRTSELKLLAPDNRGAEGQDKGKSITARWGIKMDRSGRCAESETTKITVQH